MAKVIQFLREVKIELIKVSWPKQNELMTSTGIVLALTVILAIFIGIADWIIQNILYLILAH